MTHQEILLKATQKAIDNGWKTYIVSVAADSLHLSAAIVSECNWAETIFNHDFAKALWGEQEKLFSKGDCIVYFALAWEEHLRRMVVSDDPIKYLGENLDD